MKKITSSGGQQHLSEASAVRVSAMFSMRAAPKTFRESVLKRVEREWLSLVGYTPPHLSIPAQIHRVLTATSLGWWWDFGQLIATLVSCALYVFSTYIVSDTVDLEGGRELGKLYLEWITVFAFIFDFALRWVSSANPLTYLFQIMPLVDLAQIIPTLVELLLHAGKASLTSRILRIFRIIRVFRVLRFFRLIENFSSILKQALRVSLVIFSVVFILAGLMQLVETELGSTLLGHAKHDSLPRFDFGSAFYFGIVTVATVGYGDYFPVTELGKVIVCIFILICLIVVPNEINRFAGECDGKVG